MSFFSKSHLTLQQWLLLMFFWMDEEEVTKAAQHLDTSLGTAINVYQWFSEICSSRLVQDGPARLGGPGRIVLIDESCFSHKPKHHRRRPPVTNIWVFRMVDPANTPALDHMEIVPNRRQASLLLIHTLPNTTIHLDDFSAYRRAVARLPNVAHHAMVNHSLHCVDLVTNVHTQHVESYWNRVKIKFKKMRGVDSRQLPSYLDEFMWRERYIVWKDI